jgi:predicted ABC-type exoprotein transport system permease subunit
MEAAGSLVTVSGVLLGFLFSGFWWILNREISFDPEGRHFKLCYALIFTAMAILAVFGVVIPLYGMTVNHGSAYWCFVAVTTALVLLFGYMFGELGHYRVFRKPHYITTSEAVAVTLTVILAIATVAVLIALKPT